MNTIEQIEAKRQAIIEQMAQIKWMKRGTINKQFLPVKSKRRNETVLRGPYYVFSRQEGDRTKSKRLKAGEELEWARQGVEEYKKFKNLGRQFEELSEQLGEMLKSRRDLNEMEKNG